MPNNSSTSHLSIIHPFRLPRLVFVSHSFFSNNEWYPCLEEKTFTTKTTMMHESFLMSSFVPFRDRLSHGALPRDRIKYCSFAKIGE